MNIMAMLLAPVVGLTNHLATPSKYLAFYDIKLGTGRCHITVSGDVNKIDQDTHINAFTRLLGHYFYTCDDRQKRPMHNLLSTYVTESSTDFTQLMSDVEGMIYETFNKKERAELAMVVKSLGGFIGGGFPAFLSDEDVVPKLGHYRFYLLKSEQEYSSRFFISPGLDKQLVSRSLIFMFEFIDKQLDSGGKKMLRNSVANFLQSEPSQ